MKKIFFYITSLIGLTNIFFMFLYRSFLPSGVFYDLNNDRIQLYIFRYLLSMSGTLTIICISIIMNSFLEDKTNRRYLWIIPMGINVMYIIPFSKLIGSLLNSLFHG